MSNWEGFTDEDLKRVKHQAVKSDGASISRGGGRGRPGFRKKPQRPGHGFKPEMETKREQPDLLPEQRLSAPPQKQNTGGNIPTLSIKTPEKGDNKEKTVSTGPGEVNSNHDTGKVSKDKSQADGWENDLKEEVEELMDEEEIVSLEMSNLDKFREQQKMIEELNRKKKQLLASAIQKRQKQAKAEAVKLMQIQKELEKLDQLLTVDVSIIRDRIEDASREYMEAQKRYDRAEKEFITAKMHLFESQEQKEQLTEHLYTVIHQNEVRKAKKLKELMEKLEMESTGEDSELSELVSHMEMPSLTVLNSMQAKTIHGPKSPPVNARISLKASATPQQEVGEETHQSTEVKTEVTGHTKEAECEMKPEALTEEGSDSQGRTKAVEDCGSQNSINDVKEEDGKLREKKLPSVASVSNNNNCENSSRSSSKADATGVTGESGSAEDSTGTESGSLNS